MFKLRSIFATVCVMLMAFAVKADYVIIPVEAPVADTYKTVPTSFIQVGKVIAIECTDVVTNKTVTFSRILAGGSTNVVSTLTTTASTGDNQTFDLSASGYFWMQKGETWWRGGTETNATVRLIIEQ